MSTIVLAGRGELLENLLHRRGHVVPNLLWLGIVV